MSEVAYEDIYGKLGYKELPEYIDEPLSEEEKREVVEAKDHGVKNPAIMVEYRDIDEFRKRQNNFYAHFARTKNPIVGAYRTHRAFQRFEILYPELTSKLLYKVSQSEPITDEQWHDLFEAYQKMSKLVDSSDAGYVHQVRELPEHAGWYLCA